MLRYNSDGTLDNSFDGDGWVAPYFGLARAFANAVAVQPDGKILVAGSVQQPNALLDFSLLRLNPDGSPDQTFDGDGFVATDFGFGTDEAAALALQADGKIVLAGKAFNGTTDNFAVTRYLPDGSRDLSFSGDGRVTTAVNGGISAADGVAVRPDGRIVVGGQANSSSGNSAFALAGYLPDGTLDPTFGTGGTITKNISGSGDLPSGLLIQPDGKVIMIGEGFTGTSWDFLAARFNQDGSLDPSFGTGGIVTTDVDNGGTDFANGAALQANGQLLVTGYTYQNLGAATQTDVALVRYRADGSLDHLSDGNGIIETSVTTARNDVANGVAIQADGKVVVVGSSFNGTNDDMAIVRYNRDGSLDASFGGDGTVIFDFDTQSSSNAVATAVAIEANGTIDVVGWAGSTGNPPFFAIARFNPDGTLILSFRQRVGSAGSTASAIAIQSDGKIVVAGQAYDGQDRVFALTRFDPYCIQDPSFNGGNPVLTKIGVGEGSGIKIASVLALAIQPDGKIVAAGHAQFLKR